MKVYVLPADNYGCGHYRLIWPAEVCRQQGMDVQVMPPAMGNSIEAKSRELPDGSREVISVKIPEDTDVLVVQRPAHPLQAQIIDIARQNGVAVVVDMDDDMSAIHPGNVAYHYYRHSNGQTAVSWKWATECCKRATLVVTSTRSLQKIYAKHGRGVVIDNYVPEKTLTYDSPDTDGFGWAGTISSHPTDLKVLGRTAVDLVNEGFPLRIVGPDKGVREQLRLTQTPAATGTVGLENWISTIGSTYSVGMVPLEPSAFNTSKSRLKGIEHMAAGVPWIASPREEYRRLHRESGCGLLADSPKEWYAQLKRLLTDDVLRKEQAEKGREYMADQTIQAQAWRWAEAWTAAYCYERGIK